MIFSFHEGLHVALWRLREGGGGGGGIGDGPGLERGGGGEDGEDERSKTTERF